MVNRWKYSFEHLVLWDLFNYKIMSFLSNDKMDGGVVRDGMVKIKLLRILKRWINKLSLCISGTNCYA